MFRTILVPLDSTPLAEQALPWAHALARRADARLELAEVHGFYAFEDPKACWVPPNAELDAEYREREQLYLDATAKWMSTVSRVSTATAVLPGSVVLAETVAESLLERVRLTGTDLVVMATHRRGAAGRFAFGSVAQELFRRSGVPVLVVQAGAGAPVLIPEPDVDSVLVPLDGSPLAERALEPAADLARLFGARCELLRVVESRTAGAETNEAQVYLDTVSHRIAGNDLAVGTRVVVARSAAEAIVAAADGRAQSIVALATHGRGGFGQLLMGSVAKRVARCVSSPILFFRPPELG